MQTEAESAESAAIQTAAKPHIIEWRKKIEDGWIEWKKDMILVVLTGNAAAQLADPVLAELC